MNKNATGTTGLVGDQRRSDNEPLTGAGWYSTDGFKTPTKPSAEVSKNRNHGTSLPTRSKGFTRGFDKIAVIEPNEGDGPGNDLTAKHKRVKQSPKDVPVENIPGFVDHFMIAVQSKKGEKSDGVTAQAMNGAF